VCDIHEVFFPGRAKGAAVFLLSLFQWKTALEEEIYISNQFSNPKHLFGI
jgi:hypothetical protein